MARSESPTPVPQSAPERRKTVQPVDETLEEREETQLSLRILIDMGYNPSLAMLALDAVGTIENLDQLIVQATDVIGE